MSNSSTHDTKRSEDVRARINILSEIPAEWQRAAASWSRLARKHKTDVPHIGLCPEPNEEFMIYQTLIGVWPNGQKSADKDLIERLKNYLLKSMKEAKLHTTWTKQNQAYEDAVVGFMTKIVSDSEFVAEFLSFTEEIMRLGKLNSVSQTIVKITAPGVPDIYQGQEVWDFSLVDPDNRRPVDYATRKALLARVKEAAATPDFASFAVTALEDKDHSGLIKMLVTERLLCLRNVYPALFLSGDYTPLSAKGPKSNHVIAYTRSLGDRQIVIATSRFFASSAILGASFWHGTTLSWNGTKGGKFKDVLTDTVHTFDTNEASLHKLFERLPFVVLEKI